MPIHEFHCNKCSATFEELVFSEDEKPACPSCGSADTEKLMSACSLRMGGDGASCSCTSGSSSHSCAGCSGGNCASCGH